MLLEVPLLLAGPNYWTLQQMGSDGPVPGKIPIEHFHRLRNNDVTGFTSTRVEHREITCVQLVFREDFSG